MKRVITIVALFLSLQFLMSAFCLVAKLVYSYLTGGGISMHQLMGSTAGIQIAVTLLSSLLMIALMWRLRFVQMKEFRNGGLPCKVSVAAVLMMLTASITLAVVAELFGLPDHLQGVMEDIVSRPSGMLAVGIVGPVCEEVVFRGGILGGMLQEGRRPWVAIGISALIFGVIHFNPVQIFCAGVMGVLLGWVYWRTRSLLPAILMHVANNLLSVLEYNVYGASSSMAERMGSMGAALALAAVMLVIACGIGWYLNRTFNYLIRTT